MPTKKSTFVTVAGATGVGVAVKVMGVPAAPEAPGARLVASVTLGAVTLTLTIGEVAVAPLESVTLEVRAKTPAAVGAQLA